MSAVRSYEIGPFTLEKWYTESEKLYERLQEYATLNKHQDIKTYVLTTDRPNYYFIRIDISELSDY